jgi:membrane associated rhomboid family serine protease
LWDSLRPTPTFLTLVGGLFVLYVLIVAGGLEGFAARHLILWPHRALGPEPWQLVTNSLVHERFGGLLNALVGIWLFGTTVELYLGRTRFLLVLFGSLLAGSLAVAILGRLFFSTWILATMQPAVMAMLAAYARLLWNTPMSLFGATRPIRGGALALVFIAVNVLVELTDGAFALLTAGLAAAGSGAIIAGGWGGWNVSANGLRNALDRLRLWRLRRRYKVISGGRDTKRYLN